VTDGVHALMETVEAPCPHAMIDCRHGQTKHAQLRPTHNTVLRSSELGDCPVGGAFTAHVAV
jgi:hypothetical protein